MQEEQEILDAHEVKEYVDRPRGNKVIPFHWICSEKVDEFVNIIRFKAITNSLRLQASSWNIS